MKMDKVQETNNSLQISQIQIWSIKTCGKYCLRKCILNTHHCSGQPTRSSAIAWYGATLYVMCRLCTSHSGHGHALPYVCAKIALRTTRVGGLCMACCDIGEHQTRRDIARGIPKDICFMFGVRELP